MEGAAEGIPRGGGRTQADSPSPAAEAEVRQHPPSSPWGGLKPTACCCPSAPRLPCAPQCVCPHGWGSSLGLCRHALMAFSPSVLDLERSPLLQEALWIADPSPLCTLSPMAALG